jgi:DNA repair exonuclease SbcCD ATPase subunit
MSSVPRLTGLELEAFRGFANRVELDLDAEAILIRGDNGTGKTSITDGLLWLLSGDIPRLRDRSRGRRKEDGDAIVSRYRSGDQARVSLTIRNATFEGADGKTVEFERIGNSKGSEIRARCEERELREGQAELAMASAFGDFTTAQFTHAVGAWGVLQQHDLLDALEGGSSLHERLAELVGLQRVNQFAASAKELAKATRTEQGRAEDLRDRLRQRHEAASVRLQSATAEASGSTEVSKRRPLDFAVDLPAGVALSRTAPTADEFGDIVTAIEAGMSAARQLLAAGEELRRADTEVMDTDQLEQQLIRARREAEVVLEQAPARVQLADAALGLLGDECPVCEQAIDESSVRAHLHEILAAAEEESRRAEAVRDELTVAESKLQSARLAESRRAEASTRVELAEERLAGLIKGATWITVERGLIAADRAPELVEIFDRLDGSLREAQQEVRRKGTERTLRYGTELEASTNELERAESEARAAVDQAERARSLELASRKASERIIERALARLQPSLAEVFDRLSPHPTFNELQARQDIFYGKNQVVPHAYDRKNKVGGHPAMIFSEGQLNVVALSYFLGLALNAGEGALPFVVLDDTLAALDVVNVLGFADLCRRLREKRQLIVTTHDRRFASLLARKLAPRQEGMRTLLIELDGWTEGGPKVRIQDQPLAEIIPLPEQRAS